MPSRNRVKVYEVDSYYHVYNRGVNKRKIFKDEQDYAVYLSLLKRYLGKGETDKRGRKYEYLGDDIELLAFCLMPNHFHLFVYQQQDLRAIEQLMRRVSATYVAYFNKKYKRVGPLFQDRYKATRIDDDSYLMHISRYIHLNPKDYKSYEWSSYQYFAGQKHSDWLKPKTVLDQFDSKNDYIKFVADYEDYKKSLESIKYLLAA